MPKDIMLETELNEFSALDICTLADISHCYIYTFYNT